jgi:hypothetical protein
MNKQRLKITKSRRRAAFTLVEIIAVLAIVLLIGAVVLAVNPGNPEGIVSAENSARTLFRAARLKSQAANPDRNPVENPLYNIRSRVIILKDPSLPEQHLRLMRVIVGGTRRPELIKPEDYFWYSTEVEYILPKGVYMVDDDAAVLGSGEGFSEKRRSYLSNKDSPSTEMRLDYQFRSRGQKTGEGDKTWYFYEFTSESTSNMNYATFMVSTGAWNPQKKAVLFNNRDEVAGFYITPTGETVPFTSTAEMEKQKK